MFSNNSSIERQRAMAVTTAAAAGCIKLWVTASNNMENVSRVKVLLIYCALNALTCSLHCNLPYYQSLHSALLLPSSSFTFSTFAVYCSEKHEVKSSLLVNEALCEWLTSIPLQLWCAAVIMAAAELENKLWVCMQAINFVSKCKLHKRNTARRGKEWAKEERGRLVVRQWHQKHYKWTLQVFLVFYNSLAVHLFHPIRAF